MSATPEQIAFWAGAGMDPEILQARRTERPFNFADVVAPMPLGFTRIEEGQRLNLGGRDWIVRFGHGHAPDHATLWSEADDIVIGGDQLLPSISPNLGVYATEPGRTRSPSGLPHAASCSPSRPRTSWSCRATSCPSPGCPTASGR
jgi:glyoxylase-like metal-dependent hydrolase (beta-lactamase superfamily II)